MTPQAAVFDTNIWLDFVREEQGERLLSVVEELQNENKLELVVSELIEEEWKRHCNKYIQPKPDKNLATNSEILVNALYDSINQSRKDIILRVEKLFRESVKPALSNAVKVMTADRMTKDVAPFHKKKESAYDCFIYFSSMEWGTTNSLPSIAFITRNTEDFSALDSRNKLHPDLVIEGLNVLYYTNLQSFLSSVEPDCFKRIIGRKQEEAIILPELVTNEPIVDQWDKAMAYYYSHFNYIPKRVMSRLYPMCSSNKMPIGQYRSGININNDRLIEFLRQVKSVDFNKEFSQVELDISENDFSKTKEIYQALNQAHIHELIVFRSEEKFNCLLNPISVCCCVRCMFRQLHLAFSIDHLQMEPTDDMQENLKQGFVRFMIRDYILSAKFFYKVYEQAVNNKNPVIQLTMAQNIKKLKSWVKSFYESQDALEQIEQFKVEDADFVYSASMHKNLFVSELSKLVYRNHFFLDSQNNILEIRNDIAQHYKIQLAGGHHSNNNLNRLFSAFSELKSFYEINSIIIDRNNERLRELYSYVSESYLMCYQMNKEQASRLLYFNDYMVLEIAYYSKPEDLRKHFKKFQPGKLKYQYDSEYSEAVDVTVRLLNEVVRFTTFKSVEGNMHRFNNLTDYYFHYLSNLIFLSSFLTFTDDDNRKLATAITKLSALIDQHPKFYKEVFGTILFLSEKYEFFTQENLTELIHCSFKEQNWQKDDWLEQMGDCLSDKHATILERNFELSEQVYQFITDTSNGKTLEFRIDYLTAWYEVLHPHHKVQVSEAIIGELRTKFSPHLYYLATLYRLCDYREFYSSYVDSVGVPLKEEDELISRRYSSYGRLNDLLNLAFGLNIPTTGEEFNRFKNKQDYYDWLLDLDKFDYGNFNIEWVLKYQTRFYLEHIFRNRKCREEIRVRLAKTPNEHISNLYFKYTT